MYRIARKSTPTRKLLSCALASCLLLGAAPAFAQSTAATIRGQVMADSSPAAQAQVTATNIATGLSRSVQSTASGSYSLAGLPPGTYRVEVNAGGKTSTQNITVQVGQTATVNLGVGGVGETTAGGAATTLDAVQVVAQAPIETKTSEIATYITPRQIEALPQGTRNFLAFADTVPGMAFEQNPANGSTKLRGGVQNANNVNVYIDGIGQKNYVTQGGITGQDASRGNPFPQLAIGEYKVITSNYKAEYDQISSAAVTAVTKSGTNEFKGSFFWDYTNQDWREPRESEKDAGKTRSGEKQYGAAFGGPIVKDKAHFFVTYEAKEYNAPQDLSPGEGRIAGDLPQAWRDQLGATSTPFKEDLYFGKLDWSINEENLVELTYKRREESEIGNVGGQSARSYGTDTGVNEDRYDLRWQFSNANWLNDAHLTYEKAFWTKAPVNMANGMVLTDGSGDDGKQIYRIGGGEGGLQDKGQKGWSFQNDTTFFGWEGHTVKFGVKYKQVDLDTIEQQPYNPQFYYDIHQGGAVPYFVRFGSAAMGTDGGSVTSKNKQFGLYIQDDWDVTERLTLNLGLRWDYEKTPSYLDYVTSGDVLAALSAVDTRAGNAPGQTYAQSLALGGIDVNRYISSGNNRKPFKDAIQPRLGFSYDLTGDERHVIFGGIGRSYDRNLFDYLQLERSKATFPTRRFKINSPGHACDLSASDCLDWSPQLLDRDYLMSLVNSTDAGREVWMFDNDLKTPYSDQISLGIRDSFNLGGLDWNSSATVQHTRYKDGLLIMRGNRYPDGGVFAPNGSPWSAPGLPGMGSLIVATNGFESKSTALLLSLDKPYTSESPWNVNVAYTLTDAKQNIHEKDPVYGWYFTQGGWYDGAWTPRHRLVISGFTDLPWGMSVSGKLTLASKIKRWDIDGTAAYGGYERPHSWEPDGTLGFKQFDLSLTKTWDTGTDLKLKMRADLLNAFNWTNWGGYGINWDTGVINSWDQYQTRTFKLSFGLDW
ncbi:TonB-dependent receptor [Stenotrophomonas sp. STM01]|uniref:TonB-dependent receptor n=1 Tax=Stenotrophomonas sp. STM01 TaxID=2769278 RepID=UPI0017833A63|nr:TonB-dependent receptor [Stenotrophomonas sp. STM01]MBD9534532.1 TonB-dependent receptor [Stenotrophomonas sp. STM01]